MFLFTTNLCCSLFIAFCENILGIYLMGLFFMHNIIRILIRQFFRSHSKIKKQIFEKIKQQQNRLRKCPCRYERQIHLKHFKRQRKHVKRCKKCKKFVDVEKHVGVHYYHFITVFQRIIVKLCMEPIFFEVQEFQISFKVAKLCNIYHIGYIKKLMIVLYDSINEELRFSFSYVSICHKIKFAVVLKRWIFSYVKSLRFSKLFMILRIYSLLRVISVSRHLERSALKIMTRIKKTS